MLAVRKISNISAPAAATALMIGMGMSSPAHAVLRIEVQNPAGVCQGALPVYDTALRNRPTAISNEGSSNAFVSCSALGDNSSNSEPPTLFGAIFVNNTGVNKTVNCTFVDGTRLLGLAFYAKFAVIPANGSSALFWNPGDDNGGNPYTAFNNLSCSLPPGVEISLVARHSEDGSTAAP